MKIAMPIWNGRISPVFDVAGRLVVLTLADGTVTGREETLIGPNPAEKTRRLTELGANVLICGAVSQPLVLMIEQAGIQVISNICGETDQVAAAYLAGRLAEPDYLMPGCCGRRRRFRGCRRRNRTMMNKKRTQV